MAARKPSRKSKPQPRRGASRSRSSSRKASKGQVPGWAWLLTGLLLGLFVAFLFHLGGTQIKQGQRPAATVAKPEKPAAPSEPKTDEPRFDFYAVLPKMEVIVPQSESKPAPAPVPRENTSQPPSTPAPQPAPSRPTPETTEPQHRYLLQAGSFRRSDDADRRRAELILQGFSATIQPVSLDSGDTWHRVMIGPYNSRNSMNQAQEKLAAHGIETLSIRMKE